MKKVLLSISLVAAAMFANAQNFAIYNAATKASPLNGTPFLFDDNNTFSVDTAASAPYIITASGTAGTGAYYISGFGNARYNAKGEVEAIGYSATNFATDKLFLNVFTNGKAMKVKVQFGLVGTSDVYGYEFDLAGSSSETAFADASALLSGFSKIVGNDPDGETFLTSALAANISKVEFAVILTGNGGTGPGEIQLKNIVIGSSSNLTEVGTRNAAKLETAVYPNPATTEVNFGRTLTNVSIFNANGVLVETLNSASSINVSTFKSGVYFINASEGTTRFVVK